jgi:hypothetical protein
LWNPFTFLQNPCLPKICLFPLANEGERNPSFLSLPIICFLLLHKPIRIEDNHRPPIIVSFHLPSHLMKVQAHPSSSPWLTFRVVWRNLTINRWNKNTFFVEIDLACYNKITKNTFYPKLYTCALYPQNHL